MAHFYQTREMHLEPGLFQALAHRGVRRGFVVFHEAGRQTPRANSRHYGSAH
jgi:hypothetical protein